MYVLFYYLNNRIEVSLYFSIKKVLIIVKDLWKKDII